MNEAKNAVLLILFTALAAAGGYVASEWQAAKNAPGKRPVSASPADALLRVPSEVSVPAGKPVRIDADTRGDVVVWMSLDQEIELQTINSKSVWVFGSKPGVYRVVCWTAVDGDPTVNSTCLVKVGETKEESTEQPAKTARKDAR